MRQSTFVIIRLLMGLLAACLLVASCTTNLAVLPNTTPPSATPVPTLAEPVKTPFIMPTPPPQAPPICPGAPPTRLILNERGRVLPDDPRPVNVRSAPGLSSNTITSIPILEIFIVLDGPVCNGNYAWYEVHYGDYTGWLAEGDLSSYYVEPYLAE